ncbi:MAG TPA: hypothetical protein VK442_00730 [Xanthobacteraceae bacterium]|nr:hypothetical protein [Xanthobacteraceae bacterium]
MRSIPLLALAAAAVAAAWLPQPLMAQDEDVFAFIPAGGRTLLTKVMDSHPPADEIKGLLTGKRTRDEWLSYLKAHAASVAALRALSDKEQLTLADYLSFNMPLPGGQAAIDPAKLPLDGRDYALEKCQGCHIITVVVTQSRPKEHWLGTMHKPSHIGIKLSEAQREQLASYLVINAGIPIDQVPEELRAGGASY